jgi:hypothetical protein
MTYNIDYLKTHTSIYEIYGDFLSGNKLDVGHRFHDLSVPIIVDRIEYLRQRCTGKKVLHIGCLDHHEIILERMKNGTWLHGIITSISDLCIGIDINARAYNLVSREFGMDNIRLLDLSRRLEDRYIDDIRKIHWDLIVCPEILEHITNHGQFLENLNQISHTGTMLIITGPNAFRFENFINALRHFESINSDHKYWFTYYTLSRMIADHGWKPDCLIYYQLSKRKMWLRALCQLANWMSLAFCDGLIIEATRFNKSDAI